MTKDEALKLALEAFKEINYDQAYANEIAAIKEALAQPEQEPVAWYDPEVMNEDRGISWTPGQFHTAPLYTSPQQRKPLLASDIVTMYDENPRSDSEMIAFARAIEAAHGIKENT